jgi:hypothetical protein
MGSGDEDRFRRLERERSDGWMAVVVGRFVFGVANSWLDWNDAKVRSLPLEAARSLWRFLCYSHACQSSVHRAGLLSGKAKQSLGRHVSSVPLLWCQRHRQPPQSMPAHRQRRS